ncbi:Arc family DNA-binding protein [Pseudomonas sp. ANT_J12]|uniref:Arc family DNA-binding protein n=1 Tax=Pseudomonas sp. ANT_J12 TaxID=2597351 RepID=UPI0011F0A402|nr:Arc family DNA-binding protein [Pseudomonas sp. ANT_J12]KAA0995435.1 Arc family DNA-binding protein [Pseudomonas sp. ANT_J12]
MSELSRTQVRFPVELMEWIKQQAREQNRSMNAQLVEIIQQARGKTKNEQA